MLKSVNQMIKATWNEILILEKDSAEKKEEERGGWGGGGGGPHPNISMHQAYLVKKIT